MISLTLGPNSLCPNPVSGPICFNILSDEHYESAGSFANMNVMFPNGQTNPDGNSIVINGITFTVDSSSDYTSTTFKYGATTAETADNFKNMLASNYYYIDAHLSLSTGTNSTVYVLWTKREEIKDLETYSHANMTNWATSNVVINQGSAPQLNSFRLWYLLHDGDESLTRQRFSNIPFDPLNIFKTLELSFEESIQRMLSFTIPSISLDAPFQDSKFYRKLRLRYGGVLTSNCEDSNGQVFNSYEFTVINSVIQPEERNFNQNHCPFFSTQVKFLTDRRNGLSVGVDELQLMWIWINNTPAFNVTTDNAFKVVYTFYPSDGSPEFEHEKLIQDPGAWVVPCGTSMPTIANNVNGVSKYTVQVFGKQFHDSTLYWAEYSELFTFNYDTNQNYDLEIYFKEDRGGLGTFKFKETTRVAPVKVGAVSDNGVTKGTWPTVVQNGRRVQHVSSYHEIFTARSGRISNTESNRLWIKKFIKSGDYFIRLNDTQGNQYIRRIILSNPSEPNFDRSNPLELNISFTLSNKENI